MLKLHTRPPSGALQSFPQDVTKLLNAAIGAHATRALHTSPPRCQNEGDEKSSTSTRPERKNEGRQSTGPTRNFTAPNRRTRSHAAGAAIQTLGGDRGGPVRRTGAPSTAGVQTTQSGQRPTRPYAPGRYTDSNTSRSPRYSQPPQRRGRPDRTSASVTTSNRTVPSWDVESLGGIGIDDDDDASLAPAPSHRRDRRVRRTSPRRQDDDDEDEEEELDLATAASLGLSDNMLRHLLRKDARTRLAFRPAFTPSEYSREDLVPAGGATLARPAVGDVVEQHLRAVGGRKALEAAAPWTLAARLLEGEAVAFRDEGEKVAVLEVARGMMKDKAERVGRMAGRELEAEGVEFEGVSGDVAQGLVGRLVEGRYDEDAEAARGGGRKDRRVAKVVRTLATNESYRGEDRDVVAGKLEKMLRGARR